MNELRQLLDEVDTANSNLLEAQAAEGIARSAVTDAMNQANGAQKKLDEALAAYRLATAPGTDWTRAPGIPVPE